MNVDVVVIGAGTVGAAIAYGLANHNMNVLVLDGGDRDFRAAIANFGLVWQQGKGIGMPAYQWLTRHSVRSWPDFRDQLTGLVGSDLQYERSGGLQLCVEDAEFQQRHSDLLRLHSQLDGDEPDWEMLDRGALEKLLPNVRLGQEVVGASFGHTDGHANPLRLLTALHAGIVARGGELRGGSTALSLTGNGKDGFTIDLGAEKVSAPRVVIAAGLGSKALAAQVGLDIPIRPQRGQILVTERLEPFLPLPTVGVRQTQEGTVMIGATHDDIGFDTSTSGEAAISLSADAIRQFPALSEAKLIRQWAGLRILTPDSNPVYAESQSHPGAFVAVCHSGVTLAAAHAGLLAEGIAAGRLPPSFDAFHHRRFDLQEVEFDVSKAE